jgi:membrane-associated phospholipid phosphatase
MSTGSAERAVAARVSSRGGSRAEAFAFSTLFVLLLAAAVIWPRPVLWINEATFGADLPISIVSFLGREAPSWDVVYWALVGFATLALFHGRLESASSTWVDARRELSGLTRRMSAEIAGLRPRSMLVIGAFLASLCAAIWILADAPVMAEVSRIGSTRVHDFVRLSNRLGGGGNPPMIVGFFVLAGLALRRVRWTLLGFAMLTSAAVAGILASMLKPLVARSRPDLWLGPFSRVWGGESSFPSGHSISAFAMVGAVFAGSRSPWLRATALAMAVSIAATRVIALRHWPSDVAVSAVIGGLLGLFAGRVFVRQPGSDVEIGEADRDEP